MYKDARRPAWVEVNLSHLGHNIRAVQGKLAPGTDIIGIIKADGYGHGAVAVAQVLRENGITAFGVATLDEAVALRDAGAGEDIVILGLTPSLYADILAEYRLTPVVMAHENAEAISRAAEKAGRTLDAYLAVDTGMGRIGLLAHDLTTIEEVRRISSLSHLKVKGIFSHFATADAADKRFARHQEQLFLAYAEAMRTAGIPVASRTMANSAAVMELPSTHFEAVRPGIVLYGCYPSAEVDPAALPILPAMSVKAAIVRLAKVPPGFSVGYGRRFVAERESLIATLPLGYADGLPRPYSPLGHVLVRGCVAPLAGNICMDQCMVDVTDVPGVSLGDEVLLMGSDGTHAILADDIAAATGTINYEVVCAFGQRLPRIYVR
jgi:alanine racemase